MNEQDLLEIKQKVNALYDFFVNNPVQNRNYNLRDFAHEVGISAYNLKKYYKKFQLAIPAPFREKGKDPVFTVSDILYMKDWLTKHGRL